MADTNKYELILNFKDLEKVVETESAEDATNNMAKIAVAWKAFAVTQIAKPFVNTVLNIQTASLSLSGRQQAQERWQFALDTVDNAMSLLGTVQGGRALGASLGIGAKAGGGIAVAVMALHKALQFVQEKVRIGVAEKKEWANIQQTETRAGWAFNKSRQGA